MIFIDTDLMYYGLNSRKNLRFERYGWNEKTLQDQYDWVEARLKRFQDAEYLFVAGHHDTYACSR
jgi:hypothetical protein